MANSASNTEIERKFLICQTEVPDLSNLETSFINQGYLAGGLRLRRRADDYFLTRKEAEGIQRLEYEQKISKELFDQSWPNTLLRRLEKNALSFDWTPVIWLSWIIISVSSRA